MSRTIFRNANLLDGLNAAQAGKTIVVEGERITAVESGDVEAGSDDRVLDVGGKTLMPGMVHCHFHATYQNVTMQPVPLGTEKPPAYLAIAAANNVRTALHCGYTGVVSAGGPHDIDSQLKMAIEDGIIEGPRILACSHGLDTTGDYNALGEWWWQIGNPGGHLLCDSPDEFRKTVRQEIRKGAEIIKLFPSGGHGIPEPNTTRGLSREELRAAVEAAHERGKLARAHCPWKNLIIECLDLGVDVIDHGDELDGEIIERLIKQGTFLVPSMLFLKKLLDYTELSEATEAQMAPIQGDFENMCKMVPEANRAGVKLVLGDDFGLIMMPHGTYAEELEFYTKTVGIPALDVIRWATVNGAELLGLGGELGSIEAGKLADLLVVDGDPSQDVTLLQDQSRLKAIMKGGAFVKDAL